MIRHQRLLSCGLLAWLAAATAVGQVNRKFTETPLGPLPDGAAETTISPDGRHIAYIRREAAGERVAVDGQEQKPYAKVAALEFSPDSKRLAYAAGSGEQWRIVVDGREQTTYARVGPPTFSPDSRRLAYVAMLTDGRRAVVVDGKAGRPCEQVFRGLLCFSPDSKRLAYGALRDGAWRVAVDEQDGPPVDFLGSATGIRLPADGGPIYAALRGKTWSIVRGERFSAEYENVGELALSADGARMAFAAMKAGKWLVVVDGAELRQRPFQPPAAAEASPRTKPPAAAASPPPRTPAAEPVAPEPVAPPLDAIAEGTLTFSPNGANLAFAAQRGSGWFVVFNGHEGKAYDGLSEMLFSPHGKQLAYIVKTGPTEMVVRNNREERIFDRVGAGTLAFSRDSNRLGYIARSGKASFVVVDGKRKQRFDMVGYLTFSPDNAHVAYAATLGSKAFTVVDEQEAAHRYDVILTVPTRKLVFDDHRRFHYIGLKGGKAFLVQEEIP